uniref:Uncharacterized protein n=1 Tax=Hyaloperonospora arabidopsidis (strain Emoy2) TaxID=559515 RepID=M4C3T6_HYAAE
MSLMRRQQKSHTHRKSTHSLGHFNRHQTQQELNGVCATIRVTIFLLMERLASNHAVSYPMLQLSIMWLPLSINFRLEWSIVLVLGLLAICGTDNEICSSLGHVPQS